MGVAGTSIEVFTTRVDTIYGASALILAPEHPLLSTLVAGVKDQAEIEENVQRLRRALTRAADIATAEKEGFFVGRYAVNPFNGEKIPIWVGNFVLMEYGTGAVMCVPAHDERDFEFATKYGLAIPIVVQPAEGEALTEETLRAAFTDYGKSVNSGPYSGLTSEKAIEKMTADAEARGFGKGEIIFRLKDWGISRQRYWGTPIPVIYCEKCGMVPVPDKDLPVVLPADGEIFRRRAIAAGERAGIRECEVSEVRRARATRNRHDGYVHRFLVVLLPLCRRAQRQGAVRSGAGPLLAAGGPVHRRDRSRDSASAVHAVFLQGDARSGTRESRRAGEEAVHAGAGAQGRHGHVEIEGQRRRGRGHGARNTAAIRAACTRCLRRRRKKISNGASRRSKAARVSCSACYRLVSKTRGTIAQGAATAAREVSLDSATPKEKALLRKAHQVLRRVTNDFDTRWHFNSATALLMELVNEIQAQEPLEEGVRPEVAREVFELLTLMLAPMVPHLAEELWEILGHTQDTLAHASWPKFVPELAAEDQVEIVVQVNGRVRGKVSVEAGLDKVELEKRVLSDPKIAKLLDGQRIVKSNRGAGQAGQRGGGMRFQI